ncbi:HD domain-containing phosphohydrolase [Legionella geestiana]|uniref:HD domain-containing phosphohydrolase n=1 Tax=Legionella geestiana TaxID=45065 RepID=UPI001C9E61A6|nr:HD domain-containing phosphohydrolase [Legionella geestiana]
MRKLSLYCTLGCIFLGLLGLLGRLYGIVALSQVSESYVAIAPSTAIAFILIGCVILINMNYNENPVIRRASLLILLLVMLHGLTVVLSYYTDTNLQIEQLLYSDSFKSLDSGFMSPATGVFFLLTGFSLFVLLSTLSLFKSNLIWMRLSETSAFIALIGSTAFLLSYLYGTPFLYQYRVIPVAISTAIGFMLLSCAIINLNTNSYFFAAFTGDNVASIIMRHFLPFSMAVFIASSFGIDFIKENMRMNAAFPSAIILTTSTFLIFIISSYIAKLLGNLIEKLQKEKKELDKELIANRNLLKMSIESAKVGIWEYDIQNDTATVSENLNEIFGESPDKKWTFTGFISSIYPEDRKKIIERYNSIMSSMKRDSFRIQCRKYWPDQTLHWYEIFGEINHIGTASEKASFRGALIDITEKKLAAEEVENFFNLPKTFNIICDIEGNIINVNETFQSLTGYSAEDLKDKNIADFLHLNKVISIDDIIKDLVQRMTPKYFTARLKSKEGDYLDVSWTSSASIASGQIYFTGIDNTLYIKSQKALESVLLRTIEAITLTVEKRDPYTSGHMNKVATIAVAITHEMGLPEDKIEGIRIGASIHDIGKIYIPAEILNRPGKLSVQEYELIKTHPQVGYEIIKNIDFPWPVKEMIMQHHEKLDGSGYPSGLKGEQIIIEAQIIAVADAIEAITSLRPYRAAQSLKEGIAVLTAGRGTLFNADAVDACLKLINEGKLTF